MSRPLKKSIENNGIIKVNKKVRKFRDKPGHVFLRNFVLVLLRTQRSYQSTHPLHKHEQLRTFPVFRFGHNEFYDQNILHFRLLGLIIYQLSLCSYYLRHC